MNISVKTRETDWGDHGGDHGIGLVTDVTDDDNQLRLLHIESFSAYCDEEEHARIAQNAITSYMAHKKKYRTAR